MRRMFQIDQTDQSMRAIVCLNFADERREIGPRTFLPPEATTAGDFFLNV